MPTLSGAASQGGSLVPGRKCGMFELILRDHIIT